MSEDTVQAPPAPSPSETPPKGLSQIAAQPEATAPPSDTTTTPPSPEGGEPEGEKREDVDWEGLTTLLDTTKEAGLEEGRSSMMSQLQPMLQRQTQHIQGVKQLAQEFTESWRDMSESENGMSKEDLNSVFRRNKEAIQAISGLHSDEGYTDGASALLADLAQRAGVDPGNLDMQLRYFRQGNGDASFLDEFIKSATKGAVTKAVAEAEARWTKLADTREKVSESARQKQAETKPADVTGTGATDNRPDSEILMDPKTPTSELQKIRARQLRGTG